METLMKTALVVTILGAINWGLVGMLDFNLVEYLLGVGTIVTRIIYVIIMACAILNIALLTRNFDFDNK